MSQEGSRQLFWIDTNTCWIQSSGLEWMNTGYVLKANDKVEVICQVNTLAGDPISYRALFGARRGSYSNNCYSLFVRFGALDRFCWCRTGVEQASSTADSAPFLGKKCLIECQNNKFKVTSEDLQSFEITNSGTINDCVNPCLLFTLNTANAANSVHPDIQDGNNTKACLAKLYSFKIISSNGEVMREFLPYVINGNVGMKDKITGQLIFNQSGVGALQYGKDN